MVIIRVTWHDREVKSALKRMRVHGGDFKGVFKELKKPFRLDLKEHAQRERGPDGFWPKRAEGTAGRYERGIMARKNKALKHRISRKKSKVLGRLPTAVTFRALGQSIVATSKVPWSQVQNEGGKVGRGSVLPARPFLFISDAFGHFAAERMAEFVVKEFGR